MSFALAALALLGTDAMSIVVENKTGRTFALSVIDLPGHYEPTKEADVVPASSVRIASRKGKILIPHPEIEAEAVHLHFADSMGNGCVFRVGAADHSSTWKLLKPNAQSMGDAVCEARTGRTIGHFIYVAR
ncbi:hypothetical protein [Sphingomonas sp. 37zxx]|uniref:hypothetical protein n=1 Tax=Sphingomonas sp. 37zxx TaxID=1550073 RepID=UPI00053BF4E2|nr:hypothetical protein [Sphingomonas sp. 37zxx]